MPFTVEFEKKTLSMTISISVGQKHHTPEAFNQIATEIINIKHNGTEIKQIFIMLGDVLQRHSLEMKGIEKILAYKMSLENGKIWLLGAKDALKAIKAAGIELFIVPWFKLIFKKPKKEAESETLDINEIYLHHDPLKDNNDILAEEFGEYENIDPNDRNNFNKEFIVCEEFIQSFYNRKKDLQVADIRSSIVQASLNFNGGFVAGLTVEEKTNYDEDKGLQLSAKYIIEEITNFIRSPKLGLPPQYYPFTNNKVAQPVYDATMKIINFIGTHFEAISTQFPTLKNLLEKSKSLEIINYWIKEKPLSVKQPKQPKESKKKNYKNDKEKEELHKFGINGKNTQLSELDEEIAKAHQKQVNGTKDVNGAQTQTYSSLQQILKNQTKEELSEPEKNLVSPVASAKLENSNTNHVISASPKSPDRNGHAKTILPPPKRDEGISEQGAIDALKFYYLALGVTEAQAPDALKLQMLEILTGKKPEKNEKNENNSQQQFSI